VTGGAAQTVATPDPRPLSAAEARLIAKARDGVSAYCRKVAQGLGGGKRPGPADLEQVTGELDELAALAARAPEASAPDGTTPRLALGDIAENLEGTNCDPRLVAYIDEALASLPAE